jgi:hypothetical protein
MVPDFTTMLDVYGSTYELSVPPLGVLAFDWSPWFSDLLGCLDP